jgi:membrane associated rhomboid family serine protease
VTPPAAPTPARQGTLGRLRLRAPATWGVLGFTAVVFALQLAANLLTGVDLVLVWGMKDQASLRAGEIWRLVTPVFIHAGPVHLLVNMYSLYVLGPAVERFFGPRRFLAVYLLAGVSGVVLSLALNPAPSVGASGAIFGLLGALAVFVFLHRSLFGSAARAQLQQIAMVLALNLVLSLTPGIDGWGHLGGLLAGVAGALLFGPRLELVPNLDGSRTVVDHRPWRVGQWRAAAMAAVVVVLAIAIVVSGQW